MLTSSSGIPQSELLSKTHTLVPSLDPELRKDGSRGCECMKGIFGCSIHPNMWGEWIVSMRASLAKILAWQKKVLALKASDPGSFLKSSEQLMSLDLSGFSLRTPPQSKNEAVLSWYGNWWREDTPGETESLVRLMSEPHTGETAGGSWPTPTTQDNAQVKGKGKRGTTLGGAARIWPTPKASPSGPDFARINRPNSGGDDLVTTVVKQYWATPTAQDAKNNGGSAQHRRNSLPLNAQAGGVLNPTWVAWLMGWPLGATSLSALEMDKFHSRRQRRGGSLVGRKGIQ